MQHEFQGGFGQIRIRPLKAEDIEAVRLLRNRMRERFVCRDEISQADQERWYHHYLETPHDYMFIVESQGNADPGERLGTAALYEVDSLRKTAEFGRLMIAPDYSGRGVGFQATVAVCRFGFERWDLSEITLQVYQSNPAARRLYKKAGFVWSGSRQMKNNETLLEMVLTRESFQKILESAEVRG